MKDVYSSAARTWENLLQLYVYICMYLTNFSLSRPPGLLYLYFSIPNITAVQNSSDIKSSFSWFADFTPYITYAHKQTKERFIPLNRPHAGPKSQTTDRLPIA